MNITASPKLAFSSTLLIAMALLAGCMGPFSPPSPPSPPSTSSPPPPPSTSAPGPSASTPIPSSPSKPQPAEVGELKSFLLKENAHIDRFRARGPFKVTLQKDRELVISRTERIKADLYLSSSSGKAPLVVLLHGHGGSKEDHGNQAMHLASWGLHSLSLQLKSQGPWIGNGNTLARLIPMLRAKPELLDKRIDRDRIILAGHSFGASAIAVALARGFPVAGSVLLDPAGVGRTIPAYLRKVRVPVMVIASDERIGATLNRGYFYANIPRNVVRVAITDASHEDAQFPLAPSPQSEDSDAAPVEALQLTYASALTAAAISLGFMGSLDYAWKSVAPAVQAGTMFNPQRKK